MIRLASWIIAALAVSAAIAWLISLPGTLTIAAGGYVMQPRLGTAAFIVIIIFVVVILVWAVIRRLLSAPKFFARRARDRRKAQGIAALSDGFIALQAGDHASARHLARQARNHLPDNAAARLLEARAHLGLGDMASAREHYRALISNEKTALAALTGLHEQARAQGRDTAALTFAQKAAAIAPNTPWASAAVFDDLVARSAWAEALAMTESETGTTRDEKKLRKRRQAVLHTAIARDIETSDPQASLDHGLAALKLVPDFVPAALIAARVQINRGQTRKARSLLHRVWRLTQHPDIAALYANAQPGASALERFKRIRELVESPPPDRGQAMVLARAAIDAFDWSAARNALANFATGDPSQGLAMEMAEIEEGQDGDQGKAREWLSRAVRAPRDPVWTADGVTSDEWEPVSPVTGRLDAFEWKVPLSVAIPRGSATSLATPETGTGPDGPSAPLALPQT